MTMPSGGDFGRRALVVDRQAGLSSEVREGQESLAIVQVRI